MSNIGQNIEVAIQSMLKVSEDVAEMQAVLTAAKNDLNMLQTLFSVSKYISVNQDQHVIMSVLEDSIKGVFGANSCQVIFDKDRTHLSNSTELYEYFDFHQLISEVSDILVINDVSESDTINLEKGTVVIIRLSVGDELYGFLVSYWEVVRNLTPSSLVFLQIISNQVSMFLKSDSLVDKFKVLAVNDPLTGIYNRSYFNNIEDSTSPVLGESIIMFDIDHFKRVNDTMGHQFGDKILIEFAKILTNSSEEYGAVPFKYGGEEFIIKCEGGLEVARHIAENVRKTFKTKTGYSVSAGISTVGDSCKVASYKRVLGQADSALYVSKQSGRDKTTIGMGDIQILKKSIHALIKLFSKAYRKNEKTTLFRLKVVGEYIIKEENFSELNTVVAGMGRMYDDVFLTDALDILFIMDDIVDQNMFTTRVKKQLCNKFKDLSFEIYSLESVFNEVIKHSKKVAKLGQLLAEKMGFKSENIEKIRLVCEWYDIGKICINPVIYCKPQKLTKDERAVIEMHTWMSAQIAENHPSLADCTDWVLYHHENYDGSGYYGLKGDEIPIEAQIISLLDKYTALIEKRCYRPAYKHEEALAIIKKDKNKFNPILLREFIKAFNQITQ